MNVYQDVHDIEEIKMEEIDELSTGTFYRKLIIKTRDGIMEISMYAQDKEGLCIKVVQPRFTLIDTTPTPSAG